MHNVQLKHQHHRPLEKRLPVCLLAHDMDVPMNVGSLFRIADAFALEMVYLSGKSPVPPNDKIRKTSRATEKYVPFVYEPDPLSIVSRLKEVGYKIISLEITSSSVDIRDIKVSPGEKVCLVVGAENEGVSQALLDVSDCVVHIRMLGQNSSMNVATACAIAAYELTERTMSSSISCSVPPKPRMSHYIPMGR